MNFDALGSKRMYIMDKRGEGVPIILSESKMLSGKMPEYRIIDDTELQLTIFVPFCPEHTIRACYFVNALLLVEF